MIGFFTAIAGCAWQPLGQVGIGQGPAGDESIDERPIWLRICGVSISRNCPTRFRRRSLSNKG
jgi:hypothetical protein